MNRIVGALARKLLISRSGGCQIERRNQGPSYLGSVLVTSLLALGLAQRSHASALFVSSQSGLAPSDCVRWSSLGGDGSLLSNPSIWASRSGLRFRVSKPSDGALRLSDQRTIDGKEICLSSQNSGTLSLEFEQPVTAAGAEVLLPYPTRTNLTIRAYDERGRVILNSSEELVPGASYPSRYMGALGNGDLIKRIEYYSDTGVLTIGHVDIRPGPVRTGGLTLAPSSVIQSDTAPGVMDQTYSVAKNGVTLIPTPDLKVGGRNLESVRLIRGPQHASKFQLFDDGTFVYKPEAGYSGPDQFQFAGTADGGKIVSLPATASINVYYVNSAPRFAGGGDLKVPQDCGPQIVPHWASQMTAGDSQEDKYQRLLWIVNNDQPEMFSEQPTLLNDGTLRFTPAPGISGSAQVTVWLKDNGGTDMGGQDTSSPYQFTIQIVQVPNKPVLGEIPEQTIGEGETLNLRVQAQAKDPNQVLGYSLEQSPRGMIIDAVSGLIRWTPDQNQCPAIYDIVVRVSVVGNIELDDRRLLRVNVLRHAFAPGLKPIPSVHIPANQTFKFKVEPLVAGSNVQFLLGATVSSAVLDAKTGEFSWTPSSTEVGKNSLFLISAFDPSTGRVSSVTTFTLTVDQQTVAAVPTSVSGRGANRIVSAKKSRRSSRKSRNHPKSLKRKSQLKRPCPTTGI